jgi:hypothetical protein
MKRVLLATAVGLMLSACSSTKPTSRAEDPGSVAPIYSQKLSSNFKRKGIKLEFDCSTVSSWTSRCDKAEPTGIEVTAYATSFGNSENNREQAFRVAEMQAKAKLRRFIQEDIQNSQNTVVIAKNIEKANDRIKQRIGANEEVNMSDDEATKETNWAVRENTNDTVRVLTETIRVNAAGILRGVYIKDETVVDRQTVQVTIRWDRNSERTSEYFRNRFRTQQQQ